MCKIEAFLSLTVLLISSVLYQQKRKLISAAYTQTLLVGEGATVSGLAKSNKAPLNSAVHTAHILEKIP